MPKVLIIDDERGVRESLSLILRMEGFEVQSAEDAKLGLTFIESGNNYDFIICDIKLPGMSGIEFLEEVQNTDTQSIIIMISAYGTLETSIEAIKKGAADYINKPINTEELILRMNMALERQQLRTKNKLLKKELGLGEELKDIIYISEIMKSVMDLALKAAEFKTTVLITGESGTGKELIAKAIHNNSDRENAPFVAVNCAAIPETLMESELFGYNKGAFSGATDSKRGLIEEAHGGVLFLDEIGEFPAALQPKLLRVLQEQEIRRLGDTKTMYVDVRIIAATARDLESEVRNGNFRDDLFYRLNVFPIQIPPLRQRKEDIPVLVRAIINKYNELLNQRIKDISPELMKKFTEYEWRGNVRELENVIERTMILSDSDILYEADLESHDSDRELSLDSWLGSLSYEDAKQKLEQAYIDKALSQTGGNRTKAAQLLGISRRTLSYKLKEIHEKKNN